MSILYQALSRAARENASRTGAPDEPASTAMPAVGALAGAAGRLRSFTSLSFRPGRERDREGSGKALYVVLGIAVLLTGGYLYASSLPPWDNPVADALAEIPGVAEVAALIGLAPQSIYVPDPVEEVVAETNEPAGTDDQGAIVAAPADTPPDGTGGDAMLTPPASLSQAPAAGGGIEVDEVVATEAPPGIASGADDAAATTVESTEPAPAVPAEETVAAVVAEEIGPAAIVPATDPSAPVDAPPEQARETLEQTLQRLANERGLTELAPPVEVVRTPSEALAEGVVDVGASPSPEAFEVTVNDRAATQQASFEAAYASLLAGNTDGALDLYLDVLRDDPDNTFALFGLASTLQRIGWLAEARATYEELLAIEPDNRGALANMMTLISQEAPEQAIANLQRLHEINPGFSPIPAQLGVLYAERGDVAEAVRFLSLAMELSPENVMYVYNLAIIQDRVGNVPEAKRLYQQVLAAAETRDVAVPLEAVRQRVAYLNKL